MHSLCTRTLRNPKYRNLSRSLLPLMEWPLQPKLHGQPAPGSFWEYLLPSYPCGHHLGCKPVKGGEGTPPGERGWSAASSSVREDGSCFLRGVCAPRHLRGTPAVPILLGLPPVPTMGAAMAGSWALWVSKRNHLVSKLGLDVIAAEPQKLLGQKPQKLGTLLSGAHWE